MAVPNHPAEIPSDRSALSGWRLFAAKLRRRPVAAMVGLSSDYLTYLGMVAFWLFLVASKRPLASLERRLRRPLRAGIIDWAARRARG